MTFRFGTDSVSFKDISIGQIFASKSSTCFYIKVEGLVTKDFPKPFNAVNLVEGTWSHFYDEEKVSPISGVFQVEEIE